jgi:hypothetical protein
LVVWGISSLYSKDSDLSITTKCIENALKIEPDYKMNPLILSLYLDRLLLRQDSIKSDYFKRLFSIVFADVLSKEISSPCYQVILTRCLIMAKKNQDFLRIVKSTPANKFINKDLVLEKCKFFIREYNSYNEVAEASLRELEKDTKFMKSSENRKVFADFGFSLKEYKARYNELSIEFSKL